jgi:hypothetical protein
MAEDFNKKKPYRDELKSVFLLASILGIMANIISVASAYQFFYRLLLLVLDNAHVVIAITALLLLLLEAATVFLIYKAVKFILHMQPVGAIIFLSFALFASWGNFYTSTTGLQEKSYEQISNKKAIQQRYKADSLSLEARIQPVLDSLNRENSILSRKTTLQNATLIAANASAMKDLRDELRTERKNTRLRYESALENDKVHASDKSLTYWRIVVVNQVFLYVTYIFKAFYFHRTHEENKSVEARVNEFSQHLINKVMQTVNELGNTAVGTYFAHTLAEAERQLSLQKPVEFEVVNSLDEKQEETTTKPKPQIVGFQTKKTSSHESSHKPTVSSHLNNEASHNQEKTMRVAIQDGDLRKLKKHATLVGHIIANTDESSSHISNSEIIHIQELATNAKNKSRSLIQNLYGIVSSIGYKKAGRIVNG